MRFNQIVSGNYNERLAQIKDFPWLLRSKSDQPRNATPYRSVMAQNVTFGASTEYEKGFGCMTVAYCETAIGSNANIGARADHVRLKFGTYYFEDPNGKTIYACKSLLLRADGSVYAIPGDINEINPLSAEQTTPQAQLAEV